MSDSTKFSGNEETQGESLTRGGIAFLSGLLLCGAALAAQAALLHVISGRKSN